LAFTAILLKLVEITHVRPVKGFFLLVIGAQLMPSKIMISDDNGHIGNMLEVRTVFSVGSARRKGLTYAYPNANDWSIICLF
jgi:hypothetical protein